MCIGIGHAAIDGGGAYTYLNTKTGTEFSATLGFTKNFENYSTRSTSYAMFSIVHADARRHHRRHAANQPPERLSRPERCAVRPERDGARRRLPGGHSASDAMAGCAKAQGAVHLQGMGWKEPDLLGKSKFSLSGPKPQRDGSLFPQTRVRSRRGPLAYLLLKARRAAERAVPDPSTRVRRQKALWAK
jgi:hypothetical protein